VSPYLFIAIIFVFFFLFFCLNGTVNLNNRRFIYFFCIPPRARARVPLSNECTEYNMRSAADYPVVLLRSADVATSLRVIFAASECGPGQSRVSLAEETV
jgi:hypothetical protein